MLLRDAKRHFYGTEGESSIPIKIGPGNGATGHLIQNQEKLQKKKILYNSSQPEACIFYE